MPTKKFLLGLYTSFLFASSMCQADSTLTPLRGNEEEVHSVPKHQCFEAPELEETRPIFGRWGKNLYLSNLQEQEGQIKLQLRVKMQQVISSIRDERREIEKKCIAYWEHKGTPEEKLKKSQEYQSAVLLLYQHSRDFSNTIEASALNDSQKAEMKKDFQTEIEDFFLKTPAEHLAEEKTRLPWVKKAVLKITPRRLYDRLPSFLRMRDYGREYIQPFLSKRKI